MEKSVFVFYGKTVIHSMFRFSLVLISCFISRQVFRSIGYKSIPVGEDVPFNSIKGVIPNVNGRVIGKFTLHTIFGGKGGFLCYIRRINLK